MAVEFEVRLIGELSAAGLRESASTLLQAWFPGGQEVSLDGPIAIPVDSSLTCRFAYGGDAVASAVTYRVADGTKSTAWVTFSAAEFRTPQSVLLAALLAALAAREGSKIVVDEAQLMGKGTEVSADEIVRFLANAQEVGDLDRASVALFGHLFPLSSRSKG